MHYLPQIGSPKTTLIPQQVAKLLLLSESRMKHMFKKKKKRIEAHVKQILWRLSPLTGIMFQGHWYILMAVFWVFEGHAVNIVQFHHTNI